MSYDRLMWFGRYEGWLRQLARGVREKDAECIGKAAGLFDLMLPKNAVVVPMPSHTGQADAMLAVAKETGRRVVDCLRCVAHESNYTQKKHGFTPEEIKMWTFGGEKLPNDGVFVIDNVICSGVTAAAALSALPNAHVCALAYSTFR